jgi:hypothetical protein
MFNSNYIHIYRPFDNLATVSFVLLSACELLCPVPKSA